MPEPTPEAWAQIRHEYENTERPLAHICAEHEITVPMLRYRMKRWAWRRRKPLVPREGPPAADPPAIPERDLHGEVHPTPPAFASASAGDPPPPGEGKKEARPEGEEGASIVPRLQSAVARVLPAIEATIARLAEGPQRPRDMEQAGRALSSLIRALRELRALLAEHRTIEADDRENAIPQDMDAFRLDLAQRLTAIMDRMKQEAEEAKPQET